MLSWEYPPHVVGGLGQHVADLVPALARRGIEVHLVTPKRAGGQDVEMLDGFFVHRVEAPVAPGEDFITQTSNTNLLLLRASESIIARYGPFDLIHNHDWLTFGAAREIKGAYRLPLVGTIHATERGRGRGGLHGEAAQRINDIEWQLTYESWRVICCARFMRQEIMDYFGAPEDKLDIIPNGVDPAPFEALNGVDLSGFRGQYARPEEDIVFSVGRIVVEKGIEVLIRAVPEVLAKRPQVRFVIAGRGPELERLRALVDALGLREHVLMAGFISDADRNRLFKVANCAVFPSLYEPFGIVALEAMAARTPVVVSEVGGLREVVRHAETGITVYPNNPASCAWGILHTLEHPEWAQMRVENAFRDVETVFNWDNIARQTAAVYQRVADERAKMAW
jgi:glycosyltransferase involved in cell wall biosynthesis